MGIRLWRWFKGLFTPAPSTGTVGGDLTTKLAQQIVIVYNGNDLNTTLRATANAQLGESNSDLNSVFIRYLEGLYKGSW